MIDPELKRLNPKEIRLIGEDNRQIGIFDLAKALKISEEKSLDLILVNAKAQPPVVKLGNLKEFLIKRKQEKKKKQKKVELKEIKITVREAQADLERKKKQIIEFLNQGHQVMIRLILKGREKVHPDFAEEKFNRFLEMIKEEKEFKFVQPIKKTPNFFLVVIV